MNSFDKLLSLCLFVTGLLASPLAWSENDCRIQECNQLQPQLELLRMQVKDTNTAIKKLETALINAQSDVSLLQNGNSNKLSAASAAKTGFQNKVNGRGFRYHYSKE